MRIHLTFPKRILPSLSLLTAVCSAAVLSGCQAQEVYTDTNFFAMDTVITLRLPKEVSSDLRSQCIRRVEEMEAMFSRTVPTSEIARFNASAAGSFSLSEEAAYVVNAALKAANDTRGAFDPTVAPLSVLWDITGENPSVPDRDALDACLSVVGYEHLQLDGTVLYKDTDGVCLDLGGCAKGSACQAVTDLLLESGVTHGIVSFGGNIGAFGHKEDGTLWKIGIKDPSAPDQIAGYLYIENGFVSVSGDYERYFEQDGIRYHHIFDRESGYPADSGVHSAAVYAEDAVIADILSTAMFVMGAEKGMEFYESGTYTFEAVWYLTDGSTVITPGIRDSYEHAAETFSPPA